MQTVIQVNGRRYRTREEPVVGICLDGCAPEYLEAAAAQMPHLRRMVESGTQGLARTAIPSFTNPNNVAILTGVPPAVNGIPGNYYFDPERGEEVMMNDPAFLRCPTLLAAGSQAGWRVAAVTAKDKLRRLLAAGWQGICFSVEKAHQVTREEHGIGEVVGLVGRANPGIYDPEASVFCLEAGVRLLEEYSLELLYLSTTDYVQHKHPPGSPAADQFYARLDRYLGELDAQGAIVGLTADHGMNDKTRPDGSPNVRFLESLLREAGIEARVILPIADPYVVHHGALGSYATVHLAPDQVGRAAAVLRAVPGVEEVLARSAAAACFQLPADRIGELVVLADRGTVLGRTPEWHDLTVVAQGLRSHGGRHEAEVPLIVNRPLQGEYRERLEAGEARNFDLFDLLCNGVE